MDIMNGARTLSPPGKTRVCPHCKSVILDSASICPACHHHLRFGQNAERRSVPRFSAFHVEGTVRQTNDANACEYSVVVAIRDEQGRELKRQVIDVGALEFDEMRTFDLTVEVMPSIPLPMPTKPISTKQIPTKADIQKKMKQ
jgi:hypothetical protein